LFTCEENMYVIAVIILQQHLHYTDTEQAQIVSKYAFTFFPGS